LPAEIKNHVQACRWQLKIHCILLSLPLATTIDMSSSPGKVTWWLWTAPQECLHSVLVWWRWATQSTMPPLPTLQWAVALPLPRQT
jgi:hypothetical protein